MRYSTLLSFSKVLRWTIRVSVQQAWTSFTLLSRVPNKTSCEQGQEAGQMIEEETIGRLGLCVKELPK